MYTFPLGVIVSLSGHCVSALGMNLQRYAYNTQPSISIFKRRAWLWGLFCLAACELLNFLALALVPASIVAPLGSFSVICSAIFGKTFFGEDIIPNSIYCIALIVVGAGMTVYFGPKNNEDIDVDIFWIRLKKPQVYLYLMLVLSVIIILSFLAKGRPIVAVALASISSGNTIVLTKALAMFVKISVLGFNQMNTFLPYLIMVIIGISVAMQLYHITKAMENAKSYVITALYFVMLTAVTIINSSVIFGDFIRISYLNISCFVIGALCTMIGVWILAAESNSESKIKNQSYTEV